MHDFIPVQLLGLTALGRGVLIAAAICVACAVTGILSWHPLTGGPEKLVPRGYVESLAFSADGKLLAAGRGFGCIELWDPARSELIEVVDQLRGKFVGLDAQGTRILAGDERQCALYDRQSRRTLAEEAGIRDVVMSADGAHAATPTTDARLLIWNLTSGGIEAQLQFDRRDISAVAIGPTAEECAVGTARGEVFVMNVKESVVERELRLPDAAAVVALAFDDDGEWLAAGSALGELSMWNRESDVPAWRTALSGGGHIARLAVLDEDRLLVAEGPHARLVSRSAAIQSLDAPLQNIDALAVTADGRHVAAGCRDEPGIVLFDMQTGKPTAILDRN